MKQKILVIGGVGHLAGADLSSRIVKELNKQGAVYDADYPHILTVNASFCDANVAGEGLEGFVDWINEWHRQFNSDVMVTACCTSYHERPQDPVFSAAIDSVIGHINGSVAESLVVFQSAVSQRNGLYQRVIEAAEARNMTVTIVPEEICNHAIDAFMQYDDAGYTGIRSTFSMIVKAYMQFPEHKMPVMASDKTLVLLGCTELCLGHHYNYPDTTFINMTQELAEATVARLKHLQEEK